MAEQNNPPDISNEKGVPAGVMDRNIKELVKLRQKEEKEKSRDEHIADKITGFTGTMPFVYVHLTIFALYIFWNAGLTSMPPIDPTFTGLSTIASVEAIFLSTFVLIRQNRMNKISEKRESLDLQVSLLAEHEITRLITLVTKIADKLKIEEANNPEIDELTKDVYPEKVLDTIDRLKQDSIKENGIEF